MTQQELNIIKNEILDQIALDSKLIEELVPETSLKDTDLFEINGGRYVSFKTLRSLGVDLDKLSEIFLSKTKADRTAYDLTVGGRLKGEGWTHFGDFVAGLQGGAGGGVDSQGNGELESLRVRTSLTAMELVVNEQSVERGDCIFTEGDTVESCEPETDAEGNPVRNADGTARWWVRIRERYDGYRTGLAPGMVLRGVVQNLFDAAQSGAAGTYYTSWMRVNGGELGTSGNRLNVTLYAGEDVPAGRNYPPCALMVLARWGHQTDARYQRLIMINSHDGQIVRYEGVDSPIIGVGNIAALIGRLPEGLLETEESRGVQPGDEVVYARHIFGNFHQIDTKQKQVAEIVYTGEYDAGREYRHEAWTEDGLRFVTETCTYRGCVWLCAEDGIVGVTPGYGVTCWAFYQGNPEFTVDFEETQVVYDERHLDLFGATLTLKARLYNQDVLPWVREENVAWSRESYDSHGALRAASDAAWSPRTDMEGKRLLLDRRDLSYDGTEISRITFTARVALDDTAVGAAEAAMEFSL